MPHQDACVIRANRGEDGVPDAAVPRRRPVDSLRSPDEALLYSAALDRASVLNRTAAEIWELCDGSRTVGTIRGALAARYRVDESLIGGDVAATIAALLASGLIDVSAGTPDGPT